VRTAATTLSDVLGRSIAWDETAQALVAGFQDSFALEFARSELDPGELAEVERLSAEVYGNPDWTLRR
jgi:lipoate-protein ligase A